jgi:hypothetical protein
VGAAVTPAAISPFTIRVFVSSIPGSAPFHLTEGIEAY